MPSIKQNEHRSHFLGMYLVSVLNRQAYIQLKTPLMFTINLLVVSSSVDLT